MEPRLPTSNARISLLAMAVFAGAQAVIWLRRSRKARTDAGN